mgnify:FL=1
MFIGGITGNQPQNIEIDLGFIPAGQSFTLTSFEDGINADRQAMDYKKKEVYREQSNPHDIENGTQRGMGRNN